ncbi:MAG TPA: hypothetical protein VK993_04015 [Chthoniobacterales bacterium]|nr:hypothetical protein [Chthoniobacterales bacterium]
MTTIKIRSLAVVLAFITIGLAAAAAQTEKAARDASLNDALGVYSGPFGPNTITMRIEKIEGETASGYSAVGKNRRPFSGSVIVGGGSPRFELREPGDNAEDGVFRFQFLRDEQALAGTWTPNNKKLAQVSFRLTKGGNGDSDSQAVARGQRDKTAASSGHTDGTLVTIEARGDNNYFVLKDNQGQQHSFASLHPDMSQLSYLGGPQYHVGKGMRIHWRIETLAGTGEKVKSIIKISKAGSKMYIPPKGSAEREAIIEAVRADYQRRYNKQVTINLDWFGRDLGGGIQVENGWAGVVGTADEAGNKAPGDTWVAILRGSGTKWKVVGTSAGDEKAKKRGTEDDAAPHLKELKRLWKEYPNAPESILGLLDYP